MILWLTGNTEAGKTTIARKLCGKNTVLLDGDDLRNVWPGFGYSKEDRWENCLRVARLAKLIESQGLAVVVAVICPYENLRVVVENICGCKFIYVPGGKEGAEFPYEVPTNPVLTTEEKNL